MTELTPLVPLAGIPGRRWAAPPLSPDKYDPDTLERLIRYLESSPMILAWMGYTEDLIGGRFSIPGGSSTMSDGKYFCSGNKTKSVSYASFLVRGHCGWPGRFRLDSGCCSPV